MKKAVALLLSLLMLLPLASACSKDEQDGEEQSVVTEGDGTELYLPSMDFEGKEFTVVGYTNYGKAVFANDDAADVIQKASAQRTNTIQDKYGVVIKYEDTSDDYKAIQNSSMGGLHAYDMMLPHPTQSVTALMTSGLLADLQSMEYTYLDKPWWNQSQVENYTVNGKLYFGVSDLTLNMQGFSGYVMNETLYKQWGYEENLYTLMFGGGWTVEKMKELVVNTGLDAGGIGDIYGLTCNTYTISNFFFGSGEKILNKDADGYPTLKLDVDKCQSIAEKCYDIIWGQYSFRDQSYNAGFPTSTMWKTFAGGQSLFQTLDFCSFSYLLRNIEFDLAFFPQPKYDENQSDYRTICAAGFIGIPKDAQDYNYSSLILEALSYHSYKNFRSAYYDVYLSYQVSQTDEARRALEVVYGSVFYDLGYTLDDGSILNMLYKVVIEGGDSDVASYIAKNEAISRNAFNEKTQKMF